ncbi:MAG: hypothetical protein MUQ10_07970 [Anaerolineae bacterium]|nr:hypothetical protein [Anaerolineae bacterium]
MDHEPGKPWFHGSPVELRSLHAGSKITQNRALARAFSHKPTFVTVSHAGEIRHNGTEQGHLYLIAEDVQAGDVTPHPRTTMAPGEEWLTTRELRVEHLWVTVPVPVPKKQLRENELALLAGQLDSL